MYRYFKIYISIINAALLSVALPSFAATTTRPYIPLEPSAFPGISTGSSNLGVFLSSIFNWTIAIAVVLALIFIIWGGIEYMTTDSWSGKEDGRTKIWDALLGLGLALISWLILYTINPKLVTFSGNTLLGLSSQNTNLGDTSTNPGNINFGSNTNNNAGGGNSSGGSLTTGNTSVGGSGTGIGSNSDGSNPCPTCIDVTGLFTLKNGAGNELDANLAHKLQSVLPELSAQVTEAFPTTVPHISGCHDNGTCADVAYIDGSTDVNEVRTLYDALVSAGLRSQYEVVNPSDCQRYRDAGVPCNSYDTTTGSHFHVNL